jgi:iron(III) transport system substrate-binding protein
MQLMGEAEAWKFMDALHQNIAVYTHSGSAPCVQAARGDVSPASPSTCAPRRRARRANRDHLSAEGIGRDMEAFAIVKGTKVTPPESRRLGRSRPRASSIPSSTP